MEAFSLAYNILSACGVWRPPNSTGLEKNLYYFHSIVFVPLPFLLVSGMITQLCLAELSFEEFTEILLCCLATLGICFKSLSFVCRRKQIIELSNMVSSSFALPQSDVEVEIHARYQRYIRYLSVYLFLEVLMTVVVWVSVPFFQPKNHRILPYKVWLPYDSSPELFYWPTYALVSLSISTAVFIAVGNDSVMCGFMMIVCSQLELLSYRLVSLPEHLENARSKKKMSDIEIATYERNLVKQHIIHHLHLYKFADAIRSAFSLVISTQFLISSLIISISIYQLSTSKSINMDFLMKLCYLICVLVEFFVFCWFSNELTIKSQEFGDYVYNVNWLALRASSKKSLMFLTLRATKPIVVSYGFFVVLSLESFTKVLKISYSSFNLLRTSSAA